MEFKQNSPKPPVHRRDVMTRFRNFAQHIGNPLHVMCRLREAGVSKESAKTACKAYERFIYRAVLG